MYKGRFCSAGGVKVANGYVETDPSGRYGRFRDILGRGAMKTVYRAFDEFLGIEVAWNQVKLGDVFHSPEQLQRLYSEVHLLKHLDHKSMMIFYGSWIDIDNKSFNFITELFTSGSLREYRQKYKRVDISVLKNWACQILSGLKYLHSNNPPIIHRDLKCDNIFVNGHMGQLKIGDLGLATILCGPQQAQSVIGTPEFMAPELYEEKYNELVDIYSFGMCMIEMLTLEFPYSECSNPAQIYKRVTSGKLPDAIYKIQDLEAKRFVGRCLAHVSKRPSAKDLLLDPFLATEHLELSLPNTPLSTNQTLRVNSSTTVANELPPVGDKTSTDMAITGSINEEDNTIFLKVRISDEMGHTRHIFFPFDTKNDTAMKVALEMVEELEISHLTPLEIAEMIDHEILALFPTWMVRSKWKHLRHDNLNSEEDKDVNNHNHPFYLSSSPSTPHGSLPNSGSSSKTHFHGNNRMFAHEWPQQDLFVNYDGSSPRSMNSYKCSNFHYYENEHDEVGAKHNKLKWCEKGKASNFHTKIFCHATMNSCGCSGPRISSSMQERRSMQVQQSLLDFEEMYKYKRRMYNTVGAVDGIGFQHPDSGTGGCCSRRRDFI